MTKIKVAFLASLLAACNGKKHFQKYVLPSESPCLDGTVLNIDSHGCKSFFWGVRQDTIKIRCTMTDDQSWWVNTSFYFVPKNSSDPTSDHWQSFCADSEFRVYKGHTLIKVGIIEPVEKEFGFTGRDHKIKNGEIVRQ